MTDAKARYDQAIADRQARKEAEEAQRQQQAREAEERRQAEETRRAEEAARQEEVRREEAARREAEARRQETELARQAEHRHWLNVRREEEAQRARAREQAREEEPERPGRGGSFFDRAQNVLRNGLDDRDREDLLNSIDRGLDTATSFWNRAKKHGRRMAQRLQEEGIIPETINIPQEEPQEEQQTYTFDFKKPSLTLNAIKEHERQEALRKQFVNGEIPFADSLYSMAQEGNADAQWVLGALYFSGDYRVMNSYARFERAAYWLEKSANQGNANGQYYYGCCFACGAGVEQDMDAAFQWWKRAAEQWHEDAINLIPHCTHVKTGNDEYHVVRININGFPKTDSRYTKHYVPVHKTRKEIALLERQMKLMNRMKEENRIPFDADPIDLAKLGDADAQWLVALSCYLGTCGAPSGYERFEHAAFWAKKAADQGHAFAQWLYGDCLACGAGVAKDLDQAIVWWRKAADQGLANAEMQLNNCEFDFWDHAHLKEELNTPLKDDYYMTEFPSVPEAQENQQQDADYTTSVIRGRPPSWKCER